MKTIDIKGTPYVTVNSRLTHFREHFKSHSLISEIVSNEDGICIIKATISDESGKVLATGHAFEKEGSTFINRTSHIENCETSAWGRALGNFGIGVDAAVASYEEVANAVIQQKTPRKRSKQSVCAEDKTISKEDLEQMMFDCESYKDDLYPLWALLTEEQQADKEIKEWFTMRKGQINN